MSWHSMPATAYLDISWKHALCGSQGTVSAFRWIMAERLPLTSPQMDVTTTLYKQTFTAMAIDEVGSENQ